MKRTKLHHHKSYDKIPDVAELSISSVPVVWDKTTRLPKNRVFQHLASIGQAVICPHCHVMLDIFQRQHLLPSIRPDPKCPSINKPAASKS